MTAASSANPTTSAPDLAVDRAALDRLLRPERIAIVGASDKNLFSRRAFAQHQRMRGAKPLTLVNPRSPVVHGTATVPSCQDIDGGIDCAFLMTPQALTEEALADAAAAGARAAVILSQGWAEEGEQGRRRQESLVARARELDMVLLGPNHLGFANLWDGVAPCALGLDMPVEPGSFALVSQSGAVGSALVGYAGRHDVRFSFVVTTGNESMISIADAVRYLVQDEHTRAIGVFAETIRKVELFREAARLAADAGKAIIVLKAGASELAAETARAHTGALVGDDRVIDAVLRQEGVIRVKTLEDLITTGALCASTGPLRAGGVGVLSVSGGACDLIADLGAEAGLRLPPLGPALVEQLATLLPPYGHPQNPLDVTGGALADPEVWRRGIEIMAQQTEIGLVGVVTSLPRAGEPQRDDTFHAVGRALRSTGLQGVIFPQVEQAPSDYIREVKLASGVPNVLSSVDRFVHAAAGLGRWTDWLLRRRPVGDAQPDVGVVTPLAAGQKSSEHAARVRLAAAGVPVVPAELVTDAEAAVEAAARLGGAVVLKLCSADLAHKTEIGGVELGVEGPDQVRAAYSRLTGRAAAAGIQIEGVLVGAMRRGGVELIVGVTRDPDWGPILAVGLGGVLVELLDDSAIRALPVDAADVREMLDGLRGSALLKGFRGRAPADLDRIADVVVRIAALATELGPALDTLEVNPLLVDGDRIEALDVLITASL